MPTQRDQPLRVLVASAEMSPLAKVGGLADVVGALPKALRDLGHDARVALPLYGMVRDRFRSSLRATDAVAHVALAGEQPTACPVFRLDCDDLPVYLIDLGGHFAQAAESESVYTYEAAPYIRLAQALTALATTGVDGWQPDVLHCNDWHTGMAPVYVGDQGRLDRPATVFTVHNLAYRGEFEAGVIEMGGLAPELFTFDRLEYYGRFSFLKAGMVSSDQTNTVSPTYAREVETPEYGLGMEGVVRHLRGQGRFFGILNGIDTEVFDPATDAALPERYDRDQLDGKATCKASLQRELGLRADPASPLIGMVSRICDQKGYDLVARGADTIARMGAQLAILGVGDPDMMATLSDAARRHPTSLTTVYRFDPALAQRIYAGSDLFLMPSRFEPCGLGQLMALRYGSVPVVRRTGGLADTVFDADERPRQGNGFVFEAADTVSMLEALRRAVSAYSDARRWRTLVRRAMAEDHGWHRAAPEYVGMYRRALSRDAGGLPATRMESQ